MNVSDFLTTCGAENSALTDYCQDYDDEPEDLVEVSPSENEGDSDEVEGGDEESSEEKTEDQVPKNAASSVEDETVERIRDSPQARPSCERLRQDELEEDDERVELACLAQPLSSQFALRAHIAEES